MTSADTHTLTGAYALGALDDEERGAVERHLARCPACDREVRELAETAARLGLAVAAAPAAALRSAVLARIAAVRQEPPPVTPLVVRPRPSADGSGGRPSGDGSGGRPAGHGSRVRPARRGPRPLARWALAACLAVGVGLGGIAVVQYGRAEDARREALGAREAGDAVASVLAAPDARMATVRLAGGARGTVVVSTARDRAVFAASGMAPPPRGRVYQLWYDDDGRMRPAGLMPSGSADVAMPLDGPVRGATGMGVTVEPAGGSPRPTSSPVALLAFPKA